MLKYIIKEEYQELLGKDSVPDNFNNLVIQASNYINHQTFGRVDKYNPPEEVKYVTCLIIDLYNEQEIQLSKIKNLKSQNIEGWEETYITPEEIKKDYSEKMQTTLADYLWNVVGTDGNPLLFSGVC